MADKDHRSEQVSMIETRSADMCDMNFEERIITVIAVPYEQATKVMFRHEPWDEVFSRSAFNGFDPQKRRIPVTACLEVPDHNHSGGRLVGRIVQTYPDKQDGLIADLKISRTDIGQETLELARDGAISPSLGFMVKNPYQDEILDRRNKVRRVNRAFIDHLAFVAEPAYPGAKVLATRSDGIPEADFPPAERPIIDDFLDDPLFQWASERTNRQ